MKNKNKTSLRKNALFYVCQDYKDTLHAELKYSKDEEGNSQAFYLIQQDLSEQEKNKFSIENNGCVLEGLHLTIYEGCSEEKHKNHLLSPWHASMIISLPQNGGQLKIRSYFDLSKVLRETTIKDVELNQYKTIPEEQAAKFERFLIKINRELLFSLELLLYEKQKAVSNEIEKNVDSLIGSIKNFQMHDKGMALKYKAEIQKAINLIDESMKYFYHEGYVSTYKTALVTEFEKCSKMEKFKEFSEAEIKSTTDRAPLRKGNVQEGKTKKLKLIDDKIRKVSSEKNKSVQLKTLFDLYAQKLSYLSGGDDFYEICKVSKALHGMNVDIFVCLQEACRDGNLDDVKRLIPLIKNINFSLIETALYYTAIEFAITNSHLNVLQCLAEEVSKDFNWREMAFGQSPLMIAIESYYLNRSHPERFKIIEWLVKKMKADPSMGDMSGEFPLGQVAFCEKENCELASFLIHNGADVNQQKIPMQHFHHLTTPQLTKKLLEFQKEMKEETVWCDTAAIKAVGASHYEILSMFMKQEKFNPNVCNTNGATVLSNLVANYLDNASPYKERTLAMIEQILLRGASPECLITVPCIQGNLRILLRMTVRDLIILHGDDAIKNVFSKVAEKSITPKMVFCSSSLFKSTPPPMIMDNQEKEILELLNKSVSKKFYDAYLKLPSEGQKPKLYWTLHKDRDGACTALLEGSTLKEEHKVLYQKHMHEFFNTNNRIQFINVEKDKFNLKLVDIEKYVKFVRESESLEVSPSQSFGASK